LIKGSVPSDFPFSTPLQTGDFHQIETEQHIWLIYDLYHTYDNGQGLWVRGLYALDDASDTLVAIRQILTITLPFILIFVIFAGHRITKKAFDPITKIIDGVNSIHYGHDLSKRLPQGENRDELYDLTETLNSMIGRLEEAFQSEKEFISDVSHELKTPLAVTLAECEYILQANRSAEEYRESIATIEKQTGRTLSMVQQLLQISRTIHKDAQIEKETFNLSQLGKDIIEELSYVAQEQEIKVIGQIQPDIEITADETLIMRAIMNLLTNAIKYKRNIPDAFTSLHIEKSDTFIKISVSDNGIGISEEDQSQIFRKFYKVDKSRSREGESFGLGLAMVKWIVEAHGGTITVESQIGNGSIFTVILPC